MNSTHALDSTQEPSGCAIRLQETGASKHTEATKEFTAIYQAGFEAGFTMGREAGLKGAGQAAVGRVTAPKTKVRISTRRRVASEHFLLGLPCRACGAYYGSDEKRCPLCKTRQRVLDGVSNQAYTDVAEK